MVTIFLLTFGSYKIDKDNKFNFLFVSNSGKSHVESSLVMYICGIINYHLWIRLMLHN